MSYMALARQAFNRFFLFCKGGFPLAPHHRNYFLLTPRVGTVMVLLTEDIKLAYKLIRR